MSIRRGTKAFPNSCCKRSASACLRTEPNTRNPFERSTFAVPHPIPVETPVTTTSLLFAIAFLLRWITVHLQYLLLLGGHYTKRQKSYDEEFGSSSFKVAKGRRGLLRRRPAACQVYGIDAFDDSKNGVRQSVRSLRCRVVTYALKDH